MRAVVTADDFILAVRNLGVSMVGTLNPPLSESVVRTGERSLSLSVRGLIEAGVGKTLLEGLPYDSADTVVFELALRGGYRCDMAIFHVDGSASVVEIKDGRHGSQGVVAGIGQVGLYAVQLAGAHAVKRVQRALMWSTLDDSEDQRIVVAACKEAGVVPLWAPPIERLAMGAAILSLVESISAERNS